MMLTFLALISFSQTNEVLSKFEDYVKKAQTLSVTLRVKLGSSPMEGSGIYYFSRPLRQAFKLHAGTEFYTWTQTASRILEVEHSQKLYHESDPAGNFIAPESSLSSVPEYAFPSPLAAGTLNALIPRSASFAPVAEPSDPTSTTMVANFQTPRGMASVRVRVAADGRLLSLSSGPKDAPGLTATLTFSNYKVNEPIPSEAFSTALPIGYMPDVLPAGAEPANVGMKAPLDGLTTKDGKKANVLRLLGNKPALLVVAGFDCEPSKRLLAALPALSTRLKQAGAATAVIWTEKRRLQGMPMAFPEFYDPKGNAMGRFYAPATPFWMIVDGKGKIMEIWVGYDSALAKKYQGEALAAIREAG